MKYDNNRSYGFTKTRILCGSSIEFCLEYANTFCCGRRGEFYEDYLGLVLLLKIRLRVSSGGTVKSKSAAKYLKWRHFLLAALLEDIVGWSAFWSYSDCLRYSSMTPE